VCKGEKRRWKKMENINERYASVSKEIDKMTNAKTIEKINERYESSIKEIDELLKDL
jgi:phosphopantetheine adenylyltransferase